MHLNLKELYNIKVIRYCEPYIYMTDDYLKFFAKKQG